MEKIEKILLLAVLGVVLLVVGVMALLPPELTKDEDAASVDSKQDIYRSMADGHSVADGQLGKSKRPLKRFEPLNLEQPDAGRSSVASSESGRMVGARPNGAGDASERRGAGRGPGMRGPGMRGPGMRGPGIASSLGAKSRFGVEQSLVSGSTPSGSDSRTSVENASLNSGATIALEEFKTHPANRNYVIYHVRKGDSLSKIVQEFCASSSALEAIVKVNEQLASDPDALRDGDTIMIPKSVLLSAAERARRRAERFVSRAAEPRALPVGASRYEVKANDSLWSIAVRAVGSRKAPAYIKQVRSLNPQIKGDLIKEKMRLVLPASLAAEKSKG